MTNNYYAEKLNSSQLFQVYETALPRVKQYLDAEIAFVRQQLTGKEHVLELGAGYGRIMKELAPHCRSITGIDISEATVRLGKEYLIDTPNADLSVLDVHAITASKTFDTVIGLQNALSSMKVEAHGFVNDIMKLVSDGGQAFFSSYSPRFWDHRLAWFQEQAAKGLLGEIDVAQTKDGVIVCKDGFRATTYTADDLENIGRNSGWPYSVREVDESSVFLVVRAVQL